MEVGVDALLGEEAEPEWDIGSDPVGRSGRERHVLGLALGAGLATFFLVWGALVALPDGGPSTTTAGATQRAEPRPSAPPSPSASVTASATPSASPTPTPLAVRPTSGRLIGTAYAGPVRAVTATDVTATCEDGPSTDGSGSTVTFEAPLAADGDPSTAWRCPGDGVGERLVLRLPGRVPLAELSLVPGWAQTDPTNGNDRYAQNRRLARVRWTFDHGAFVNQTLDTDPATRAPQVLRVPAVRTSSVTLEVLDTSEDFERDAAPVSEVRLAAARDDRG
ncbi:MAG: NADase-type glycan-binding domain-containing protein [Actinomycetes bacterium]